MSLLYKQKEEQTVSVEIKVLEDKRIVLDFYSDCGKFGTDEALAGYVLTPERLFEILRDKRNSYSDNEL
jgi:hypothetical protein